MKATESAEIVKAVGALTKTVSGKVQEIDSKVEGVSNRILNSISVANVFSFYVDAENGDNSNDGMKWTSAKQTIESAVESTPLGAYVNVYVKRGQTHQVTGSISCMNRTIRILGDGYAYPDLSTCVDIEFMPYVRHDGRVGQRGFVLGLGTTIFMRGIRIKTATLNESYKGKYILPYSSAFSTMNGKGDVILEHTIVDIFHMPLMHQHTAGSFGSADLYFRNAKVIKNDLSGLIIDHGRQYLMDSYGSEPMPFILYGVQSQLEGAGSWKELISRDITNASTNLYEE